ncbi:MAG TPA: FAD-dependent oxidoreductase [Pyrinomonadaceae bacterium]
MKSAPVLVIGGGPAGIAAAIALGSDGLLLEGAQTLGGLSMSLSFGGAVFDLGGHSFHTPHPQIREMVFEALDMFEQERVARCYHQGEWIPYPFQKHFGKLSCTETVSACAQGMAAVDAEIQPAHFEQHLVARFGDGLARHFMLPYNRKLWGDDLTRMETAWTSERIPSPAGGSDQFREIGGVRSPLQDTTRVAYPAHGGFSEIYRALAERVKAIELGVEVVRIDPQQQVVHARNGDAYRFERLISTLPLPRLMTSVHGAPPEIVSAVTQLEAIGLDLVLVAVAEPLRTTTQRIYSAEVQIPAHKIVINHNSSDWLRSLPAHGIVAEVSCAQAYGQSGRTLERSVVDDLVKMGIVRDPSLVKEVRQLHISHAYPVPTHQRPQIVQKAKEWLAAQQIYTVGRFGEWSYINSDEALHRGLQLGRACGG